MKVYIDIIAASMNESTIDWFENGGKQKFTCHTISIRYNPVIRVFATDINGDEDKN